MKLIISVHIQNNLIYILIRITTRVIFTLFLCQEDRYPDAYFLIICSSLYCIVSQLCEASRLMFEGSSFNDFVALISWVKSKQFSSLNQDSRRTIYVEFQMTSRFRINTHTCTTRVRDKYPEKFNSLSRQSPIKNKCEKTSPSDAHRFKINFIRAKALLDRCRKYATKDERDALIRFMKNIHVLYFKYIINTYPKLSSPLTSLFILNEYKSLAKIQKIQK